MAKDGVRMRLDPGQVRDIVRGLESLPKASSVRRVIRTGVRKGTAPMRTDAKKSAPRWNQPRPPKDHKRGELRRSMSSIIKTYSKSGTVVGIIGPKKSSVARFYAHLVEQGHSQVVSRGPRKGTVVGRVEGVDFMAKTFSRTAGRSQSEYTKALRSELPREIKRQMDKLAKRRARGR